jgi:hypothetical protein
MTQQAVSTQQPVDGGLRREVDVHVGELGDELMRGQADELL